MSFKGKLLKLFGQKKYTQTFDPQKIERVLIVRPGRIGDVVCMFPLLRELKKAYPHWQLDVYAGIHSNYLFDELPYVNTVYTKYKKRQPLKTFGDLVKMYFNKYDLIIDTMPMKFSLQMSLMLLRAEWMVGLEDEPRYGICKRDLSRYYKLLEARDEMHMVELMSALAELVGVKDYSTKMEFPTDTKRTEFAQQFCHELNGSKRIGLNVDASSVTRNLYKDQIVEICQKFSEKDVDIILFSLPSRREELEAIIHKHTLGHVILSYPTQSILDATALLREMDLIISPDTSIIHIASACNIPTVGIYRNNDPHITRWGPRSDLHAVIKSNVLDENSVEGFSIEELVQKSEEFLQKS